MTRRTGDRRFALRYARAYFHLQGKFGLSLMECVLADAVATLSRRTGWCYASREYLASLFAVTPRSVRRCLNSLKAAGLIESASAFDQAVRPTRLWFEETGQASDAPARRAPGDIGGRTSASG